MHKPSPYLTRDYTGTMIVVAASDLADAGQRGAASRPVRCYVSAQSARPAVPVALDYHIAQSYFGDLARGAIGRRAARTINAALDAQIRLQAAEGGAS